MSRFVFAGMMMLTALGVALPARACEGAGCANGLVYEAFGPPPGRGQPVMAFFIHGDVSAGGPADYMYAYARQFAASRKNVVAIALLRPGYFDRAGRRSSGSDNGRRDTFHSGNNRAVAGAIRELRQAYAARSAVALGHSGGAGTIGVIAGDHPGLLNGIVLASCPCDVAAWRASRGRRGGFSAQSPIDHLSGIPPGTAIVAVTGQADDNTRPELATDYVARAQARGLAARAQIVGGAHQFTGALAGSAVAALSAMAR